MVSIRKDIIFFQENGNIFKIEKFPFSAYEISEPIYEVIKYKKKLHYFTEHLVRLEQSLIKLDWDINTIHIPSYDEILELISQNNIDVGNIRIDVFPKLKLTIAFLVPHFYPPEELYTTGVNVIFQYEERPNQEIKIFHSGIKERTNELLESKNAFETLLVNNNNEITEGSRSNLFFIKGETIFTPPNHQILQGITRDKMFDFLKKLNYKIIQREIQINEIKNFDSAFLTGTSIGALPIKSIEEISFNTNGILLKKIIQEFNC